MLPNYYVRLGVLSTATTEVIRKAYLKGARVLHPDKGGSTEDFQDLEEAYSKLINPTQRAAYDATLIKGCDDPNTDFTHLSQDDTAYDAIKKARFDKNFGYDFKTAELQKQFKVSRRTWESYFNKKRYLDSFDVLFTNPFQNIGKKIRGYAKDFLSPYKAYRSRGRDVIRDLLILPLKTLVFFLLFAISPILGFAFWMNEGKKNKSKTNWFDLFTGIIAGFALPVVFAVVTIMYAFASIFMLVRAPIRALVTLYKGMEYIEQGDHIQRILNEAQSAVDASHKPSLVIALKLLHTKFEQAKDHKKRCTKVSLEAESVCFSGIEKEIMLGTLNKDSTTPINEKQKKMVAVYIGLFRVARTKASAVNQESPAATAA